MSGITVLTEKLFTNWNYELCDLKVKVKVLVGEKEEEELRDATIENIIASIIAIILD